jgi:hypothetical protein
VTSGRVASRTATHKRSNPDETAIRYVQSVQRGYDVMIIMTVLPTMVVAGQEFTVNVQRHDPYKNYRFGSNGTDSTSLASSM